MAINTTVGKQAQRHAALLPDEVATRKLSARLEAGKLLGVPRHLAQQEAVKAVLADTGVDYRPILALSPGQDAIPPEDVMLEPTDLAKALGLPSAIVMNRQLEALGWQIQKLGSGWEPTPAGTAYGATHAWQSGYGTKAGYNLKWQGQAVRQALELPA